VTVVCATIAVSLATAAASSTQPEPQLSALFEAVGLTREQRAALRKGRPVSKVLPWGTPSEVFAFGAVYIDGSPETYVALARDVTRLARTPGYVAVGELPASPSDGDLNAMTLDPDDLNALRACREGACEVQLPAESIEAFRNGVDWSQRDAASQANGVAREMVVDLVREYRRDGNAALGVYRDKERPAPVIDEFEAIVARSSKLLPPDVLPELRQYLLQYPDADLPGADTFFYWEKVNFGLKPTIRVNQGVVYRAASDHGDMPVIAIKQLYASHYFHTALDVSVCVADDQRPGARGFYLVTLKSSQQDGLTGVKGSVVRNVVVDRTRSSLEEALTSIKDAVEHKRPANTR